MNMVSWLQSFNLPALYQKCCSGLGLPVCKPALLRPGPCQMSFGFPPISTCNIWSQLLPDTHSNKHLQVSTSQMNPYLLPSSHSTHGTIPASNSAPNSEMDPHHFLQHALLSLLLGNSPSEPTCHPLLQCELLQSLQDNPRDPPIWLLVYTVNSPS